jgi:L-asparaginase
MTPDVRGGGVTPTLGAQELIDSVPGLEEAASVTTSTLASVPSASLGFDDIFRALAWAEEAVADGAADGVVLVQGTDTLEETSYLLDLHWGFAEPIVLTGAMRPPHAASADGAGNLLAAVQTAGAPASRGRGALVVMDNEVHGAARVRKTDTTAVGAFQSPNFGPVGRITEGRVVYGGPPFRAAPLPVPSMTDQPRVAHIEASFGEDAEMLRLVLKNGYDGVVFGTFGAGHVSSEVADAMEGAALRIPVIYASRTGKGPTLSRTYGFPGSESDLLNRGAIPAGWLDHRKARILLWSLLAGGASPAEIAREFAARGACPGGPHADNEDGPVTEHPYQKVGG